MKKLDFNKDWYYKRLNEAGTGRKITVPHDAMCAERRSAQSRGQHNIGWFESSDYVYWKHFSVPTEYENGAVLLEFEGVYHNAEVYINGKKAGYRPYGYTNFYVDIAPFLEFGQENEIRVIARNADQPNSRWYTGSGIYRPVWMYVAQELYIPVNGVKIRTTGYNRKEKTAQIEISTATSLPGEPEITILDPDGREAVTPQLNPAHPQVFQAEIADAKLWSTETPYLYTCIVKFGADEVREQFGIRMLRWDAKDGITINGEHVILKGACIHHDNGVLGACAFPEAEERKIRILKENGYNAVRSAHNPCSKALLEACDRLGMLVMDEYTDMWYIHKNEYDYAAYMQDWWKQDLKDMVEKDYNHPSVIMYSTGNEVAETGQKKGIQLTGQMTRYLHSLDAGRPVTCGINIFFNFLYSMGLGVYSDDKARKEAESAAEEKAKKKTVGSEFYNTMAGLFGDKAMKMGATLHMCDVKTRDAYANMDVAGYNYGIFRYRHDLKKYPKRLILGSETFCRDAYDFYELAKREPRIVGDFVWAGMDYMGEAGIGAWEYTDYAPADGESFGWLTAGSGRINILGFPNGEAAYTRVALEKEKGPLIAVKPVYQRGKHSPSAWKMTDAMESWTWPGCEGMKAAVEVYARASCVALYINGKCAGKKKLKKSCRTTFKLPYQKGKLTAVAYDENGKITGKHSLCTAGGDTKLSVLPEQEKVSPGGLGFIQLRYTDSNGIWKPMEKHHIKVSVENGTLEGLGNACSYNPDGYWKNHTKTYYGEALAVVRAGQRGSVKVAVSDKNGEYTVNIPIEDKGRN
ncbi:MAG: glycoside hydrolase family 2 TIM barrel-domain containing protein [Eubacteriales bacterium]|nr:glycoside hydrolase family 2 TIM barrel-domain containing protein [Eubacteriales bacterium]